MRVVTTTHIGVSLGYVIGAGYMSITYAYIVISLYVGISV